MKSFIRDHIDLTVCNLIFISLSLLGIYKNIDNLAFICILTLILGVQLSILKSQIKALYKLNKLSKKTLRELREDTEIRMASICADKEIYGNDPDFKCKCPDAFKMSRMECIRYLIYGIMPRKRKYLK